MIPGDSSCIDGSEYVWQRENLHSARPSYGRPKLTLISIGKKRQCYEKLAGCKFDAKATLFLLASRVLPAYLNFGQTKHGQNVPPSTFRPKVFVTLCITAFSPFMAHRNISLCFRAGGRRVKNFHFSQFSISLW